MNLNPMKRRRERCRVARGQMSEYIDDEPGADAEELERHLSRCPNCRRMLRNLSRTVGALQRAGEGSGSSGSPDPSQGTT